MKNPRIESELTAWFDKMLNRYSNLSFRFEYNAVRGVYWVSYDAPDEVLSSEDFCEAMVLFENDLDKQFGIEAPLFTEKDMWFEVSESAAIREKKAILITLEPQKTVYGFNSVSYDVNTYDCFTPLAA